MKRGAIVGYGSIGKLHLEAGKGVVDIVAVCDADAQKLSSITDRKTYTDYDLLLAQEQLDFVDICLPHSLHMPMMLKAIDSGIDVLCEKPLVATDMELDQLEKSLKGKSNTIITNHNYLYAPQYESLLTLIKSGSVGAPRYVSLEAHIRDSFWDAPWRATRQMSGEGVFMDFGIHLCYLARAIVGAQPKSVIADIRTLTFSKDHPDDFAHAVFEFDNGAIADLRCTAFKGNKKSASSRRVDCENATLVLPRYNCSPHIEVHWHDGKQEQVPITPQIAVTGDAFHAEFQHAYAQLLREYSAGQFRHPVTLPGAKTDLAMMFAAYAAAELSWRERIYL